MAFMELEDQIERSEVVLFPEVWSRSRALIEKGALLALRATVQQQDEGFKLLADEALQLSEGALEQLRRSQRTRAQQGARPPGKAPANVRSSSAAAKPARRPVPSQPQRSSAAAAGSPGAASQAPGSSGKTPAGQRVFIKIAAAAEHAAMLEQLKELLQQHPGSMTTVLFYESSQKLLALSDRYRIKPSPELFREIEQLLGPETVRVR
ncbi:DNA polymerase III DnaE [compost metagenome]